MGLKGKRTRQQPTGIKKRLTASQRIHLLGMLPKEGRYEGLKLIRQLREQLALTTAEAKRVNLTMTTDGGATWKDNGRRVGFTFSGPAVALIVRRLVELDTTKKLTLETVDLYEEFAVGHPTVRKAAEDDSGDA